VKIARLYVAKVLCGWFVPTQDTSNVRVNFIGKCEARYKKELVCRV
jgi:hypothetical protein